MSHPNIETLKKLYAEFSKGNIEGVLALCADDIAFQVPGKNKLSGKYDKAGFASKYVPGLMEMSGGTLQVTVHDILANDLHATVLASDSLIRGGEKVEYRTCHVWRFRDGKPIAWYEYPRDLYQYDAVWT